MKFQFFNLLAIFLATLGWVVPARAVIVPNGLQQGKAKEVEYLVCQKEAQHLLCKEESSGKATLATQQTTALDKTTQNTKSSPVSTQPQVFGSQEQKLIADTLIGLSFLLPCGLVLGIFLSDRYQAYRSTLLTRQIEMLERLWHFGSDNDATTDSERGARS